MNDRASMKVIDLAAGRYVSDLQRQRRMLRGRPEMLVLHALPEANATEMLDQATRDANALTLGPVVGSRRGSLNRALEVAIEEYGVERIRVLLHPLTVGGHETPLALPSATDVFGRMQARMAAAQERLRRGRRELGGFLSWLEGRPAVARALARGGLTVEGWIWVEQSGCFSELRRDRSTAVALATASRPERQRRQSV